jgi:hypothetical protein
MRIHTAIATLVFLSPALMWSQEFQLVRSWRNALEVGLSNAYYPPQERGAGQTLRDWGTQMESAALNNIVKEFWPEIRHKVFRRK